MEGEDEEFSILELITKKDPVHRLMMSPGECPGLRGSGWMIFGGKWESPAS